MLLLPLLLKMESVKQKPNLFCSLTLLDFRSKYKWPLQNSAAQSNSAVSNEPVQLFAQGSSSPLQLSSELCSLPHKPQDLERHFWKSCPKQRTDLVSSFPSKLDISLPTFLSPSSPTVFPPSSFPALTENCGVIPSSLGETKWQIPA